MLASALQECQQSVDTQLHHYINSLDNQAPRLKEAMIYGALLGGKRIRPFLVYQVGKMLGAKQEQLDLCAAAIECIHAYSLIHDDLPDMDNDVLRRGQKTVHIAFDPATAILAGDALQSLAFDILSQADTRIDADTQIKLVAVLAKAAGYTGMCGGQSIDLCATNQHIELDELVQLHNQKTGALICCSVEMALICAQANASDRQALMGYAKAIGLAFQVHDDILDITASTHELGKPQGSDIKANKSTFPQLLGLEGAKHTANSLIQHALEQLARLPYDSQLIADFAHYIIERRA